MSDPWEDMLQSRDGTVVLVDQFLVPMDGQRALVLHDIKNVGSKILQRFRMKNVSIKGADCKILSQTPHRLDIEPGQTVELEAEIELPEWLHIGDVSKIAASSEFAWLTDRGHE